MLPDYSVVGDPLERAGMSTHRPLAEAEATVVPVLQQRRSPHSSGAVRALEAALRQRAGAA